MNQKFKIVSIDTLQSLRLFDEIDKFQDVTDESIKDYMSYGVWVLFGYKESESWKCLQVGQSNNIGIEILSDINCISGNIEIDTKRQYVNQFGEIVEGYEYHIYLTPREQIYRQIGTEYNGFIFVCICCGNNYKDNKRAIEKYVAWKFRALFWRNGRAFKHPQKNINEPQDVGNIDPSIKDAVDMLVEQYDKQKLE